MLGVLFSRSVPPEFQPTTLSADGSGNVGVVEVVDSLNFGARSSSSCCCWARVRFRSAISSTVAAGKTPAAGRSLGWVRASTRLMMRVSPEAGAVTMVTVPPAAAPAPVTV